MAKKINYNSDYMSRNHDDRLEQLEERLTALYANAENEIRSEFTDFTAAYEKEDQARQALVEAGMMTEDDYLAWRKTQILKSNDYSKAVESMSNMLVNTDVAAMATVNGELPVVVAESYDFVQGLGFQAAEEAGLTAGTFQVYNARTVEALIRDNPDLMPAPTVSIPEDKKWCKDRINREITQGIVQGKSLQDIASNLQKVTTMDKNAAIRNARTAMTGAENLGRSQAADDLKAQGIPTDEVWSATYDDRTRDSHLLLDGTTRDDSGYFGSGIIDIPLRFPGDPLGAPEEVYNCRCRLNIKLPGIDHSQDGDLYEKFMKENFPEDYAAMKESETEIAREEARERALERQADLREQLQVQPEAPVAEEKEPEIVTDEFSRTEKVELMELYTAEEGFAMNAYARGEDISQFDYLDSTPEQIAEYTDKFTQVLENEKLDEEARVYRGMTFDTITESTGLTEEQIRNNPELLIGQNITEHGFMSTTPTYSTAESYANGNVVLRLDLPEGAKAIDQNAYLGSGVDSKELTVQRECDIHISMAYATQDEQGRDIILVQAEYIDAGLNKEPEVVSQETEPLPAAEDLLPAEDLTSGSREVVQGEDLVGSWSRREDQFQFEIDDVLDAQGFNGLPKVVSEEEFNKAVEESGFIAQRTYAAPDQETLDAYRDQLYNGDWYVNCETGGAQYGQGMYCAADYNGQLTDGIKEEMDHYQKLGSERYDHPTPEEERPEATLNALPEDLANKESTQELVKAIAAGDDDKTFEIFKQIPEEERNEIYQAWHDSEYTRAVNYTETLTITPDANIVKYDDLFQDFSEYKTYGSREVIGAEIDKLEGASDDLKLVLKSEFRTEDVHGAIRAYNRLTDEELEEYDKLVPIYAEQMKAKDLEISQMDIGSYAALKGYDAINAEGHGQSGSYTVILNRTKVIFKGE